MGDKFSINDNVLFLQLELEKAKRNFTTCDIVRIADINGKTYKAGDMKYSKEKGFHDSCGREWDYNAFNSLNDFCHMKVCEEVTPPKMTKLQIEKKLGYEIEIVDEMEKK